MSEEEEIILSENLLQELGQNNDGTQLMTAGKKKRKIKGEPEPGPEVVAAAKKRSKSEQKKLDQIKLRKDKEEKREEYLTVLHKHEITDAHRQLLTSTKDIGQSLTMKAALKKTLKRYKAGLSITEEERDLLFPRNHQDGSSSMREGDDEDDDEDDEEEGIPLTIVATTAVIPAGRDLSEQPNSKATSKKRTNDAVMIEVETAADRDEDEGTKALPIDFNDIFDENGVGDGDGAADKAKKKKRKKSSTKSMHEQLEREEEHEEITSNAIVPAMTSKRNKTNAASASVGSSLMQQLQKFKQKLKSGEVNTLSTMDADVIVVATATTTSTSSASLTHQQQPSGDANEPNDPEGNKAIYVPVSIEEPVDATGRVHVSTLPSAFGTSSSSSSSSSSSARKGPAISVVRDSKIQAARLNLPVCGMEQEIVEAISLNDVVILCGETGSGKSTQVPQFLYEAGFGNRGLIGITQPRRVAATSTAERVAEELSEPITGSGSAARRQHNDKRKGMNEKHKEKKQQETAGDPDFDDAEDSNDDNNDKSKAATVSSRREGSLVAYQIRFDASTIGDRTRIKFMTDGILLREVTADLLLRQYSVILLDEAHERNVNTDILLGMLSRALPMRRAQAAAEQAKWATLSAAERGQYAEPLQPLKLVIMSATMRVEDFSTPRLFPAPPPVLRVEARQYPVTVHFSRRTELQDYLQETYKKICQIHRRLPDGGILIFLTGKREIHHMCRKVARALNRRKDKDGAASEPTGNVDRKKSRMQSVRAADPSVLSARISKNDFDGDNGDDDGNTVRKVSGTTNVMETAGLGLGVLRGLDEDEMEGDMLDISGDGDDGDDGDDYSDAESGESDSDGSGYDSLGEEEILKEEEELQRKRMDEIKHPDKTSEEEEPEEENFGDGEEMRRRMLQKVLGISAAAQSETDDEKSAALATGTVSNAIMDTLDKEKTGDEGLGSGIAPNSYTGVHVLPLFAMMTAEEQRRVFRSPPKGKYLQPLNE